jgi:hypothetical protein
MQAQSQERRALESQSRRLTVTAPTFDPDRVAHLEATDWRAYYDRKWLKMLKLMVQLTHAQFGLSWPRAIQASYLIIRASVAWAPVDHDLRMVRRYIRKFYRTAARHGRGVSFDPVKVADLELEYWVVHRELSGRPDDEKMPLIRSLARLHSATFGIPLEAAWESGVKRARAADTVDLITSKRSKDIEADWLLLEQYLREAYRSIKAQL